nr:HWE histidine kinase domain-containing protein [Stakelama sediminis]
MTNCDREPIHQLGTIQSFGFLLALSGDWLIKRASANIGDVLGVAAEDILGTPVADHIAESTIHALRNRLTMLRGEDAVERVFDLPLREGGEPYDFALHMIGDTVILEGEPTGDAQHTDTASAIRAMMARLDLTGELTAFYREGARQVRALTGFDRVMIYRFDRDGSGIVVAESAKAGIGSFLDLRYPSSDIPQQARQLYLRNPFRIIVDVEDTPVPIVPQVDETGTPLDLSLSVTRSVSPIHIEYLRNMGVGASMSISIIVEGKLWGLFACHHYSAKRPTFQRRSIAELFGQMFALKLESRERAAMAKYEQDARAISDRLLAAVASDSTLLEQPEWLGQMLSKTVPCDGIAIWNDGRVAHSGITPPPEALPDIVRRLNAMAAGRVYATDHLAGILPRAQDYVDQASGLLAIPISRTPRDYVLLFRQERIRSVTWAGDPHKPAEYGPNGPRLTPRKSFEAWSEEVRGRSQPFTNAELRVAEMLRVSLIEVVLRMSDEAQEERARAAERQELLIAELNHRVRNILSLIRGLVRQSRDGTTDLPAYINLLEGRIEALARAHDQITQDHWAPAPIRNLLRTEAAAYLHGKADRLRVEGPLALFRPQAFSTLALVIHELITNSAKYGALSDNGEITVTIEIDNVGDCLIHWRELGGPAVQPPTRQGFGSTIIQRSIPYDLGGKAEVRYPLTGLEADFCVPARYIVSGGEDMPHIIPAEIDDSKPETTKAPALNGTALLVEDSLIIAMDVEDILTRLGVDHVIVASSVPQALDAIETQSIDFGLLDINLGTETSLPIADALLDRKVPFVFASGYGEQFNAPAQHADVRILQKPYTAANIASILKVLLDA